MPSLQCLPPFVWFKHVAPFQSAHNVASLQLPERLMRRAASSRPGPRDFNLICRQSNPKFNHLSPKREYIIIACLEKRTGPEINLQNLGIEVRRWIHGCLVGGHSSWDNHCDPFRLEQSTLLRATSAAWAVQDSSVHALASSLHPRTRPSAILCCAQHSTGKARVSLAESHRLGEPVSMPLLVAGSQDVPWHPGSQRVSEDA